MLEIFRGCRIHLLKIQKIFFLAELWIFVTVPRFWVNMTYIYVIRTERVKDLRVKNDFGQILFFWVAFDGKLIFRIPKNSNLSRLTRSVRQGFRFLAKFSKILMNFQNLQTPVARNFAKNSNSFTLRDVLVIVRGCRIHL